MSPVDKLRLIHPSPSDAKPPPTCDTCGKRMWWHGSTEGWGCPGTHGGSPDCRSSLYRPKRGPRSGPWPYDERYPELADEEQQP